MSESTTGGAFFAAGEGGVGGSAPVTFRQCHAYSPETQRCTLPSNHVGDHEVRVTWTEEDCWTPVRPPSLTQLTAGLRPVPQWNEIIGQPTGPAMNVEDLEVDHHTDSGTPVVILPTPTADDAFDPATSTARCELCPHQQREHEDGMGACGHVGRDADGDEDPCTCLGYVG